MEVYRKLRSTYKKKVRTDSIKPSNWEAFQRKAKKKGWVIINHYPLPDGKIGVEYKETR